MLVGRMALFIGEFGRVPYRWVAPANRFYSLPHRLRKGQTPRPTLHTRLTWVDTQLEVVSASGWGNNLHVQRRECLSLQ